MNVGVLLPGQTDFERGISRDVQGVSGMDGRFRQEEALGAILSAKTNALNSAERLVLLLPTVFQFSHSPTSPVHRVDTVVERASIK